MKLSKRWMQYSHGSALKDARIFRDAKALLAHRELPSTRESMSSAGFSRLKTGGINRLEDLVGCESPSKVSR